MAESDWIATALSYVAAALGSGGAVALYLQRRADRKEKERKEKDDDASKIRQSVLTLIPILIGAQEEYKHFLMESIYFTPQDDEFESHVMAPIPNSILIEFIKSMPLHIIDTKISIRLQKHSTLFDSLALNLSRRQSSIYLDYESSTEIANDAKNMTERGLSDILIDLHEIRRSLTRRYLGSANWSSDDVAAGDELNKLHVKAHGIIPITEKLRIYVSRLSNRLLIKQYRRRRKRV